MTPARALNPNAALNQLWDISLAFGVSQTFFAACKLNVFEELSKEQASAEGLASRLKLHPVGCRRLLMALKELGLVEQDGAFFRNSDVGSFCTSRSPISLDALSMFGNPFYHMWEFLPDALSEYSPRWQQALGTTAREVFAALYEDPVRLRRFTSLMNATGNPQGQEIAERFDFTPFTCLLDVAGGPGGIARPIGRRHPHLRGIIMDMPAVCQIAEEYIHADGLGDRFAAAPADLFDGPYPGGADLIVLSSILHDWDDDTGRKILRHCFEALPSGGAILVVEAVLNDDFSGSRAALMLDLHMLIVCESGGRERSGQEFHSMLQEAGFHQVEIVPLLALRSLIIARKP